MSTDSATPIIKKTAVIGSGYMGGGIAQVLALGGMDVVLGDVDAETAHKSRRRLIDQAKSFEADGLFDAGSAELLEQRLTAADSVEEAVADADYITEAVFEKLEVKLEALGRISAAAKPDAIIGSNTSAIPITELAAVVVNPERFLGVHWMNPAPFIPGVELIASAVTDPGVLDVAENLIKSVGKTPARVADTPGFVANRLQFALYKEAVKVVEEGLASPAQVDLVVSNAFGFRLALFGPFAIGDMAGLDVYASSYSTLAKTYGERFEAPDSLKASVEAGNLGVKSGAGYLDIDPEQTAALLAYRDKAYRRLSQLRTELGQAPGL
ncbi:3-hydroxybutyryl-CoA dehydrogenase [Arthrobacter sp. B3I9]|jgi:3-hydroxybutyryl-CoA dehydrogenase|uniref:3-hydroxyacyl-CoA dehydrogenase family protein n=1 Tax=Arthrobacter sp. B3I9 TaxID=3042270 RepID=UPI0027901517|nr:3-hydroxyacyl-CoA dehydrogenase family protein [Arthrobacter sp. B3I9]MDQ0848886.1 3-hydroxybutyryl-CoA dehydrogenase [Arthrobacter sp. B3I9]